MNFMEGGVHALNLLKPTKRQKSARFAKPIKKIFFNNTLEYRKVLMAFCHMDGETFVWYQDAQKKKKNQVNSMSWEVFISTI